MKKGFTLVELLGVIVILAVLSLIVVPVIDRSLKESRSKLFDTQKEQIIKALKDYYTEPSNMQELNNEDVISGYRNSREICKTITELKDSGYLPADVKNPKTGKAFDLGTTDVSVCVTKVCTHRPIEVRRGTSEKMVCEVKSSDEITDSVDDSNIYQNNWTYQYCLKINGECV